MPVVSSSVASIVLSGLLSIHGGACRPGFDELRAICPSRCRAAMQSAQSQNDTECRQEANADPLQRLQLILAISRSKRNTARGESYHAAVAPGIEPVCGCHPPLSSFLAAILAAAASYMRCNVGMPNKCDIWKAMTQMADRAPEACRNTV